MIRKKSATRGGTTAAMPFKENKTSSAPWLIAAALCGLALVFFWSTRSNRAEPPSRNATLQKKRNAPTRQAQNIVTPTQKLELKDEAPVVTRAERRVAELDRLAALDTLEETLSGLRLWSTLDLDEVDTTKLTIQSSSCGDATMKTTINDSAELLEDIGVYKVLCVAKHGGVVFDLDL